jgi:hypothetical protein
MSPSRLATIVAALGILVGAADAQAHFLFIYILPAAEAGRSAEVYFSEIADAGDPTYIDKIAHTELWMQTAPGEFRSLKVRKGADRLRAYLPGTGSTAVIGQCEYGVLARPNQTPFLLRYYPKAVAGKPEELNRLKPRSDTRLEIMATFNEDSIEFAVLGEGKPIPNALFTTVDVNLANEEFSANEAGRATWTPPSPGKYSVYVRRYLKEPGDIAGKRYEEIREFATLAFTWPIDRSGPDAEAVAIFEEAVATRARWKQFPGFSADIAGSFDGQTFSGSVTVDATGSASVQVTDESAKAWAKDQLESIAMHRGAGSDDSASGADERPVLRFGDDQRDHPLGRLLHFEGGSFASSYRVKDKQIVVVNRQSGRQNFTITILENEKNKEGLFLPHSYVVQYWDPESGDLRRTETVQDRWIRSGTWDLPKSHMVTTASESGLSVRNAVLSSHKLNNR